MSDTNSPVLLKIIWMVHFVLSTWAVMGGYLGASPTYYLTQLGVSACGLWAIASPESTDASLMFLLTMGFSVVNDIMIISIQQPRADSIYEGNAFVAQDLKNEYRFALGMSILSLILKPVMLFLLYNIHNNEAGCTITIPGLSSLTGETSSNGHRRGYSDIESAEDSHPGIYDRRSPQQMPPSYDTKHNPHQPPQHPHPHPQSSTTPHNNV